MHRLPGNPATAGHVHHRRPVVKDHQHGPVALLHQPQLHQHGVGLLRSHPPKAHRSASSRSHSGKHEPDSHRAALNAPAACSPPAAVRAAGDDH